MSSAENKAVFLSYASQDAEAARRICEALRAGGVEVWFDADGGLEHGDEWDAKIRRQIKECVLFIPVISANTQARHEGYFRIEWDLAAERARGIASGVPFILPVVIDDTREPDALVPDRFRMVQWTKLRGGEVPPDVQQRFLKLWSHRTGVLKHEATQASTPAVHTAPSAAESIGKPRAKNYALIAAAIAVIVAGAGWWLLGGRSKPAAPVASPVASRAAPATEFPRDPDLKRVYKLLYNVVDGIAEDFALMDDLVKPLLAARPNDPEVVTVAAELAQEFVTRGFDASPARRAQAQKLTERAVQLAPENPEALATLGFYLYSTKTQLGRAEELLRRAIELNPKEPRFYCFLYSVLTASNKPAAEIDAFGVRMAELFPDYPMVGYSISGHFADLSNFAAAEEWLDKSLAVASVPYAIVAKAKMMLEVHGDIEGMKHWLERMPERQRTNAGLMNAYVVLATVSGQTGPARRLLESIGDTWLADGSYTFPKALLAGELDRLDGHDDIARIQFEAAQKEVQARLAADPTDLRSMRAEMWVQLGLGHRDEARAALRINLQRRPTPYHWTLNLTWWTSALRACLLLDERAQALALLKEACVEPTGRLLLRNLFHVDPKMAPFRDDPEIVALLAEPKKETAAASIPAKIDAKSVAVLAFDNRSDDKDAEYFSDGISDELNNALGRVPGLTVKGRTSAFSFKGKNATAQEIGEKLGVTYLVRGSVRKSGDKVRITAQLSRAATDEIVWSSEPFTRDLKDIFAVQDEITKNILTAVKGSLMGDAELPHVATTKIEAYTLYLQAQGALAKRGDAGLRESIRLFEAALTVDANYVPALVGLGQARALVPLYANLSGAKARAMIDGSMAAAKRAIELDPRNPGAHAVIGWLLVQYEWKWNEGEAAVLRALELAPNDAWIWNSLGDHYRFIGEFAKGIAAKQRAWELDPLSPVSQWDLGYAHLVAGNFDQALHWSEVSVGLSPHNLDSYTPGIMAACQSGRAELMRKLVTAARQNVHENEGLLLLLEARTAIQEKKSDEARRMLTKAIPLAETGDTTPAFIGYLYLLLGDADQAATWLQRAYEQRDSTFVWNEIIDFDVIAANPKTRPILDRPGIKELYELRQRNARAAGKKL